MTPSTHRERTRHQRRRRAVLGGVLASATAGLAGCLDDLTPGDEAPRHRLDVQLQNDHDRAYDARTTLTDADDRLVVDQAFTLAPGTSHSLTETVSPGEYRIVVALRDRSEARSYWNTAYCTAYRIRTTIAADGHVTTHAICHAGDGGLEE